MDFPKQTCPFQVLGQHWCWCSSNTAFFQGKEGPDHRHVPAKACRPAWGVFSGSMADVGRSQRIVDGTTCGLVVFGDRRRPAEQAVRGKPVSRIHPWPLFRPCLQVPAMTAFGDGL